ncbi:MAG: chromate transporter [Clostridium sp.]|uniref:chromate transporter n=1 Tax=Clostridium sp. TaxID=1506 RepID=UPI003D6D0C8A
MQKSVSEKKVEFKMLTDIFKIFFKIGAFTFGGGFAMIPLIEKEMVENKGWVEKDEITDLFAVSQCIPGAIAINTASLIGYKIAKRKGAIVATVGVVLPSFLIITLIASFFSKFSDLAIVKAAFFGIRSCVVALIAIAAISVSKSAIKDKFCILLILITVFVVEFLNISPVIAIIISIIPGVIILKFMPKKKNKLFGDDK